MVIERCFRSLKKTQIKNDAYVPLGASPNRNPRRVMRIGASDRAGCGAFLRQTLGGKFEKRWIGCRRQNLIILLIVLSTATS